MRAGTGTQQDPPRGARRITNHAREGITADRTLADRHAADGGWGEDWSEDVERTYQAPPPLDLTERQLRVYRKLAWHSGRGGIIPSQKLLSKELDIPLRTLKRDIAALREKDVLDSDRRIRRGHRGGGRLLGGNQYFLKLPLNDLPDELFPPRGHRTEGPTGHAPSAQVTPRGHEGTWPVGDVEKVEESARSHRGAKPVDNPPNTPTVSESKPVEERVSSQPSAQPLSPPSGPPFRTMAEETAWVAARRRAGHAERPPPPDARWSKQRELDEEVRRVVLDAWRGADVVAVLDGPPPVPVPVPAPARPRGPVRYGRLRLDAGLRDFHRAVDRLAWDACTEGASCGRGEPCPRHQQRRREAS